MLQYFVLRLMHSALSTRTLLFVFFLHWLFILHPGSWIFQLDLLFILAPKIWRYLYDVNNIIQIVVLEVAILLMRKNKITMAPTKSSESKQLVQQHSIIF